MYETVKKRDGRIVPFEKEKITEAIFKALQSTGEGGREEAEEISDNVVGQIKERFKGRIPDVESIQDLVERALITSGYAETAKAYILYRKQRAELRKAKEVLTGVKDDIKLSLNALKVLERRYLIKDELGRPVETPRELFERVANNIALADKKYDEKANIEKSAEEFYNLMTSFLFIPNSPTLMNAGTKLQQLAACFVLPVGDTISEIFDAVKFTALIHKTGGGTGFSFSRLRPKNDVVQSTGGIASGPLSFMRVFDVATDVIKQGGKRRGANMGILRYDHPDIFDFITAKSNEGVLSNFNISVGITEDFMKAVQNGEEIDLINPRDGKSVRKVKASVIFDLLVYNAWKSGDPGIIFLDRLDRDNPTPHIGHIESTNPCVTSDTFVFTSRGPRQVKDLINSGFQVVLDGELWKTEKEGFFSTGVKKVYRIITKEGFVLKATGDHPLKRIFELTRYNQKAEWVEVESLKPGDRISLNNHRGFSGWGGRYSFKEGYVLGLLIGDGTIKKDKTVLSSWGDSEGQKSVRKLAYSSVSEMKHRSDFTGWHRIYGRGEYRLSIAAVTKLANKLDIYPGNKIITEKIEKTSFDFHRGFLRGVFDADGSVQGSQKKGVSVRLSQSNIETLEAVQRMLLRLGIFSKIYKNRRSTGWKSLPDGHSGSKLYKIKPQHELVISRDNVLWFYKQVGFGDSKKMEKLENLLSKYKRRLNRERFIAHIERIEFYGEEGVYDLQVPGINAFDANGFYAHNCGEQPLLPYEACNLGSINLSKMAKNGSIDYELLKDVVHKSVHFLDNVIDMSRFPLKQITNMVNGNRKIGLGVMGFADLLIQLNVAYDSEKATEVAEEIMKFIATESKKKSQELAKKRGPFPNFKGSVFDMRGEPPIRNATLTTIAPTGTISIIGNCSSGIEPLFAVVYVRNVMEGTELLEANSYFEDIAKEQGFYSDDLMREVAKTGSLHDIRGIPERVKRIFVTAHDIDPEWHVRMQAAFQKYVDNAVSKTVNLPYYATPHDVEKIYILGYKLGVKGITVYRDRSKSEQVIYMGSNYNDIPKDNREQDSGNIRYGVNLGNGLVRVDSEYSGGCETCSI